MNNKKMFRYIAAVCFIILFLLDLISTIKIWTDDGYTVIDALKSIINLKYPWTLLRIIGPVIVAVSLFLGIPPIASIGIILSFINIPYLLLTSRSLDWISTPSWISYISSIISCILLVVSGLYNKKGKIIGLASGIVYAIGSFIIPIIIFKYKYANGFGYVSSVLRIAGPVLFGLASPFSSNDNIKTDSIHSSSQSDTIERLSNLKKLYDNGVITEEEFSAKKSEIIGL